MPEPYPSPRRRRGRLLRRGAAFAVLLALAGYLVVHYVTGGAGAPRCVVVSGEDDGASYEFTPEQAVNAATISAVGTSRGMPERAVTIALATALQESGLLNIEHGDRDSLGLFQQRPSQGWGTEQQILDPTYAAGEFYEHLAEVPGYERLPLTVAAQRVQRSGYPQAYAKHEPDAALLAAALTGRTAATLTCEGRPDTTTGGGTDAVRAALVRDFGQEVLQEASAEVGASAAGQSGGEESGSEQSAGTPTPGVTAAATDTVTIPVPADPDASEAAVRPRGWELAHWAVANSSALRIERVSYAGRVWTAGGRVGEWRAVDTNDGPAADGTVVEVRIVTGQ
ncbi:heavy metal transporter [Streptomyces sp. NPDC002845]